MNQTLPTLFVPAIEPGSFEIAMKCAAAYASRHGSAIDAVHVRDDLSDVPDLKNLWETGGLTSAIDKKAAEDLSELKTRFGEVCSRTGCGRHSAGDGGAVAAFRSLAGPMPRTIAEAARAANLCIVALRDPANRKADAALVEDILVGSGRPCMVLPAAAGIARRPIVGWNGSVEASRALFSALPVLLSADEITVLTIGQVPEHAPDAEMVATLLRRSGAKKVHAEQHADERDRLGSHSDQMEHHATAFASDLLVIGAYSRPRWEERVFGGVTRRMLFRPVRPILFG